MEGKVLGLALKFVREQGVGPEPDRIALRLHDVVPDSVGNGPSPGRLVQVVRDCNAGADRDLVDLGAGERPVVHLQAQEVSDSFYVHAAFDTALFTKAFSLSSRSLTKRM